MGATLALAGEVPQPSHSAPASGMWLFMPLWQWKGSEVSAGLASAEKAHSPIRPCLGSTGPPLPSERGRPW